MSVFKLATVSLYVVPFLLMGCGTPETPEAVAPEVGVAILKSETAVLTSELPGRIAAVETSEVRPQINGVIRKRLFEEGAMVRAGQLLYEIEDAPYRAALGSARGGLAKAEAAIDSTRLQAERYRGLVGMNAVSLQEADNAAATAQQARADVIAQRAAVEAAKINADFTRIRAPITGRIGRSQFTRGALVQTGQAEPLATIQRTDTVYVDVAQSAAELLNLKKAIAAGGLSRDSGSARVELVLPNGDIYPLEGRLQFSEVAVNPASGAVTMRATFSNPDGVLLPGMYVKARLVEGVHRDAILAPQQGISRDPRGRATALIVNKQNKVEQRIVTTDRAIGNRWVVTSGLKAGDRLIIEGRQRANPGSLVAPKSWKPEPGKTDSSARPVTSAGK